MHKRLLIRLLACTAVVVTLASCFTEKDMDRLESLEDRVEVLMQSATAANDNAIALSALLQESTLIVGLNKTDEGYTLDLSDGTSVNVIFGQKLPALTPIIGVDSEGRWIMSLDNGETFSVIPGCDSAFPPKATPQVKVDAEDYWCYSIDAGQTWTRMLNAEGKPVDIFPGCYLQCC